MSVAVLSGPGRSVELAVHHDIARIDVGHVGAGAAIDGILRRPVHRVDGVVAVPTKHPVGSRPAEYGVVAVLSSQAVVSSPAFQTIVARAPGGTIVPFITAQAICPVATDQFVVAQAAN